MGISFLIHDQTGEAGKRGPRLKGLIQGRRLSVRFGPPTKTSRASIVLCHLPDVGDLLPVVRALANKNHVVVIYTGGSIESRVEHGIHYRALEDVEQVLGWMQPNWELKDFAALMDEEWLTIRRRGFSALAILARCASIEGLSAAAKKRRASWRRNRQNWTDVLGDAPLSVLEAWARTAACHEAEKLVQWIRGSADSPNFSRAAEEASALS